MPDIKCLPIQDRIYLEVTTKRQFNAYLRKVKNSIRRLNLSDAWIKQTERKKNYHEKQPVAITEQRQYDLLSNVVGNFCSFGLLKSRYIVTQQMNSNIDKHSIYFCS